MNCDNYACYLRMLDLFRFFLTLKRDDLENVSKSHTAYYSLWNEYNFIIYAERLTHCDFRSLPESVHNRCRHVSLVLDTFNKYDLHVLSVQFS